MALITWDRWLDRFLDDDSSGSYISPEHMKFSVHVERRASFRDRRTCEQPLPRRGCRRAGPESRRR